MRLNFSLKFRGIIIYLVKFNVKEIRIGNFFIGRGSKLSYIKLIFVSLEIWMGILFLNLLEV